MTCNTAAAGHRTAAKGPPVAPRHDRAGERWEQCGYDGKAKVMFEAFLGAGFSVRGS
jgi:hypothetical protein